jgi:hypothetical protein
VFVDQKHKEAVDLFLLWQMSLLACVLAMMAMLAMNHH